MSETSKKEVIPHITVIEVWTGHITRQDGKLISRPDSPGFLGEHPDRHSCWFYLPCDCEDKWLHNLRMFGFSAEFVELMERLAAAGYRYVRFDCDASQVEGWPVFEW